MNKYTKTKLVVITRRSSYARQYRDLADFFHITTASVFPHMIKIIFSANTLYAVDPELKNRHKVSYTTIKLFNKRLTKLKLLSTLFSINKIMKQTIFIPHNYLTLNMYLYHMPSNWHEKTAILCTDTNKQDPEFDPSLDKFLNTILIDFKNGTYLPDLEFNGNIFITNTLSSKLIDLLILKFPNVCQICIKQLDTLIEDPIEATLTHE